MKIQDLEIIDRCLFMKKERVLIVGDLHLGYEGYLQEKGWSFPKTQLEETLSVFKRIFEKTREFGKLKKIILLGDVKHYFAGILKEEFSDFYKVIELLKENLTTDGEIIITKGNHDNILEPIIRNYGFVKLVDYFVLGDTMFFHGHRKSWENLEIYDKKIKTFVLGHFHPAITLQKDAKKEKYKCFLYGKLKKLKKNIIIAPSFFPLVEGSNILACSEINKRLNISNFEVFAIDGNGVVYDFGKL